MYLTPSKILHDWLGNLGELIRLTMVSPDRRLLIEKSTQHIDDQQSNDVNDRSDLSKRIPSVERMHSLDEERNENGQDIVDEDESSSSYDTNSNSGSGSGSDSDPESESDAPPTKNHKHVQVQTRQKWLPSEDARLSAYKKKMDMSWKDICDRFPGRTEASTK